MILNMITFKCAVFGLVLCCVVRLGYAQEPETVSGRLIATRDTNPKCDPDTALSQIKQCYGCNSIIYCKPGVTFQCSSNYPYCEDGVCVKEQTKPCEDQINNGCPIGSDNKFYPDVKNCSIYYFCDDKPEALGQYECPPGFPFDYNNQACSRGTCGSFNCYLRNYALYSTHSSLAVFCKDNNILAETYTACKIDQQLGDSLSCEAVCRKQGDIPHETDTTKYYRCLPTGPWGTLVKTEQNCPKTYEFDENLAKCVKSKRSDSGPSGSNSSNGSQTNSTDPDANPPSGSQQG